MSFCSHCGVEIEPTHAHCPLCHAALVDERALGPNQLQAFASQREELRPSQDQIRQKRGLILTICSFCLAIPGLICLSTDLMYHGGGWSAYVLLSLGLVWAVVFIALFSMRHALIGVTSILATVAAYLWCIDLQYGNLGWAVHLAIPIVAWCGLSCFGIWICWVALRKVPAFVVTGFLLSVALFCLGIELSLHWYRQGSPSLSWSLIVLVALGPIAASSWVLGIAWKRSHKLQRFLHW